MSAIAKALPELRRPYTPEAVRWKIQTNPKSATGKALVVAYIDARHVASRLNLVVAGEWSDEPQEVTGGVVCKLTVCGQTRCDVGWSSGTGSDIELKTRYSDAFKRAAVKFGVGEFLYALPQIRVPARELDSWGTGRTYYGLSDKALAGLRKSYESWLGKDGRVFGAAYDHGDAADAQGDVETEAVAGAESEELLPRKGSK